MSALRQIRFSVNSQSLEYCIWPSFQPGSVSSFVGPPRARWTVKSGLFIVQRPARKLSVGTSGGGPLSISGIYRVLSNPFYAGQILYRDQWYAGKHEAMIAMADFEQAQRLLSRTDRARPKEHAFAYSGLMKCGSCGSTVTVENKKNRFGSRYVYYHCTHKSQLTSAARRALRSDSLRNRYFNFCRLLSCRKQCSQTAAGGIITPVAGTTSKLGPPIRRSCATASPTKSSTNTGQRNFSSSVPSPNNKEA